MDTVLIILHVLTAVFIVGPMAIIPMTGLRTLRAGSAAQVRSLAKSTAVFTWISLLTVILGFGVAGMWKISMSTPWVLWSLIAYLVAFLLNVIVVVPQMNKAASAAADTDGAGKPAGYGAIAGSNGLATIALIVVVVLMVWH